MSEVYEVVPGRCPACGVSWSQSGSVRPGWASSPRSGGMGGRTWECVRCGVMQHPEHVELRET